MNEKAIKEILEGVILKVMEKREGTAASSCTNADKAIPVELSARHVHLSEKDAIALYGAPLTPARDLSQPGQFLCNERVRLIGPKGVLDNVAVLGPSRSASQVEISATDARYLGVDAPVRQSGDTAGTPGITLSSGNRVISLQEGVMVAARHIHMAPEDAKTHGVTDNDLVSVRLPGKRPVVLEDVVVRVSDKFRLAMHIDSDEGNCAGWNSGILGTITARKNGAR